MASVNKVILIGNCGHNPEIRYLPSGQAVANVSIATSTRKKNRDTGETIEETQWHRISFFDRLAEIAAEYVKKGKPIYVEGRLKYGSYVDKATGVEQHTVNIIATELQLLGGRDDVQAPQQPYQQRQPAAAGARPQAASRLPASAPAAQAQAPAAPPPPRSGFGMDDDDEIPFAEASPWWDQTTSKARRMAKRGGKPVCFWMDRD